MVGQHRKRGGMNLSSASPAAGLCGRERKHPSTLLEDGKHMAEVWLEMPRVAAQMEHHGVSLPLVGSAPALPQANAATEQKQQHRNAQCPCPSLSTAPFHGQG